MYNGMMERWTEVTGDLSPGVQRVFKESLQAVADGQTSMAYGQDYGIGGAPCLVNANRNMLPIADSATPMMVFGHIVSMFDIINGDFFDTKVNEDSHIVSPLAAEILVRHFAELKPMPVRDNTVDGSHEVYVEASDEDIARDFFEANQLPAPNVIESEAYVERNIRNDEDSRQAR